MVDTHYDLLTICYVCYLKNDYSKIEKIAQYINNNLGNIKCIFANLYFMSEEEMKEELDINYYNKNVSILDMFKISKQILEYYLPNIDFIYSIEGCDYLNITDLDELYNEGLRSIVLVWNNKSKYGSGYKSDDGLTKEGIEFLNKAIDLGIGIDLSHANPKTFYGMIEVIKENKKIGKDVICYASHSNSKTLCDRLRNLTDKQLLGIKEVDGLVGVFSNINFVSKEPNLTELSKQMQYLKHIIYISQFIGLDNIMLSTDDMSFLSDIDIEYKDLPIYEYKNIYSKLKDTLAINYNNDEINKIMYKNAYDKIINKLISNKNKESVK